MLSTEDALRLEILQLKKRLLFYEQHHQHCSIGRPPSPPPCEELIHVSQTIHPYTADNRIHPRISTNTAIDAQTADGRTSPYLPTNTTHDTYTVDIHSGSHTSANTSDGITIITFDPNAPKEPPTKLNTWWRKIADELVAGVPDATQWNATRENLGLRSEEDNITVISSVVGAYAHSNSVFSDNRHKMAPGITSGGASNSLQQPDLNLIAIAKAYASLTKGSQIRASFACMLRSFQELIFTSLCVVLEHNGISVALIDTAMSICLSASQPDNLKRLRQGAIWTNRLITELAKSKDGWDYERATEMVLCRGLTISKYGTLATSSDSLKHLSNVLRMSKYTKADSGILSKGSLSIPALIKVIVGDELTLENICTALRYEDSCVERLRHLHSWYRIILRRPTKERKLDSPEHEENIAIMGHIHMLNNVFTDYLLMALNQTYKRYLEHHENLAAYTDTVRLHLPYIGGEDFKLEIWISRQIGKAVLEGGVRTIDCWRSILGDYIFEGMKNSKHRKGEVNKGQLEYTSAVDLSFPEEGIDCIMEVMLDFETGISIWRTIYSNN